MTTLHRITFDPSTLTEWITPDMIERRDGNLYGFRGHSINDDPTQPLPSFDDFTPDNTIWNDFILTLHLDRGTFTRITDTGTGGYSDRIHNYSWIGDHGDGTYTLYLTTWEDGTPTGILLTIGTRNS